MDVVVHKSLLLTISNNMTGKSGYAHLQEDLDQQVSYCCFFVSVFVESTSKILLSNFD